MAHFKKLPQKKNEGKIIYGDGIVDGIVLLAMSEVPYAELYSKNQNIKNRCNSIKVNFDKDGVHVDVSVKVHFSQCVSDMAFKIQETVRHNVESMTDYHVAGVNVNVRGVIFGEKSKAVAEITEEKPSVTQDEIAPKAETPIISSASDDKINSKDEIIKEVK